MLATERFVLAGDEAGMCGRGSTDLWIAIAPVSPLLNFVLFRRLGSNMYGMGWFMSEHVRDGM
jgi:hypothetical protein